MKGEPVEFEFVNGRLQKKDPTKAATVAKRNRDDTAMRAAILAGRLDNYTTRISDVMPSKTHHNWYKSQPTNSDWMAYYSRYGLLLVVFWVVLKIHVARKSSTRHLQFSKTVKEISARIRTKESTSTISRPSFDILRHQLLKDEPNNKLRRRQTAKQDKDGSAFQTSQNNNNNSLPTRCVLTTGQYQCVRKQENYASQNSQKLERMLPPVILEFNMKAVAKPSENATTTPSEEYHLLVEEDKTATQTLGWEISGNATIPDSPNVIGIIQEGYLKSHNSRNDGRQEVYWVERLVDNDINQGAPNRTILFILSHGYLSIPPNGGAFHDPEQQNEQTLHFEGEWLDSSGRRGSYNPTFEYLAAP